MGNVVRRVSRLSKRYNLSNRVAKELDKEKLKAAPRHESTKRIMDQLPENPELHKKNIDLHERLKQLRIDSTGSLPELKTRPLPEKKRSEEMSGNSSVVDPQRVPEGHLSLANVLNITADVKQMPGSQQDIAKSIAKEYKLDLIHVQQLLKHFKSLEIHLPESMVKDYPKLSREVKIVESQQPKGGESFQQKMENLQVLKGHVQRKLQEKMTERKEDRDNLSERRPYFRDYDDPPDHWGDIGKEIREGRKQGDTKRKGSEGGSATQTGHSVPNDKPTER